MSGPREVKETLNAGYRDLPDGKRKLNQYILEKDIGRGSFGVVQIARDEETGTEYAVKEFSKIRLRKRQQSEMIKRQGRGAASRGGRTPIPIRPPPPSSELQKRNVESRKEAEAERLGRVSTAGLEDTPNNPNVQSSSRSPGKGPVKNDLDLIRSEIAIMKKLDHPNVVKLYEVLDVQEDDSLFMGE